MRRSLNFGHTATRRNIQVLGSLFVNALRRLDGYLKAVEAKTHPVNRMYNILLGLEVTWLPD